MRFVSVRALENQAALMHHKAREMLVAQRTQLINALRGHLAEIGVIAAQGLKNARELARVILAEGNETLRPPCARRSPHWCGNCMFWIRRSHAAIEPSLRWLEVMKWRAVQT
jgi:transposase